MNNRETVGKISQDLSLKVPDTRDPREQTRENLTDYEVNVINCMENGKRKFNSDFFIEVITKKEPLMTNVIRNYFSHRLSCPTPNYDQIVYQYTLKNDQLSFIWVIPSRDTCHIMVENITRIDPDEYCLLDFVLKFQRGDLFKLCQQLNGEVQ